MNLPSFFCRIFAFNISGTNEIYIIKNHNLAYCKKVIVYFCDHTK